MNAITKPINVTDYQNECIQRVRVMSTDQLKVHFKQMLVLSVEKLIEAGAALHELESRGEKFDEIDPSSRAIFLKVHNQQILPEMLVAFCGRPKLVQAVSRLALPDQQEIMDLHERQKGMIVVYAKDGDVPVIAGKVSPDSVMRIPVARLTGRQIDQVFAKDHVRDDLEQVAWLKEETTPAKALRNSIYTDKRKNCLMIEMNGTKVSISTKDLARYVAELT
jgi:hypothetical protein